MAQFVLQSSTGSGVVTTPWGLSTDRPLSGDFDGDGKTDLTVYRPSTGTWFVLQSRSGTSVAFTWGLATDVPL